MEKPWMAGLLDALQAPPTKEHVAGWPAPSAPLSGSFPHEIDMETAPPAEAEEGPEPERPSVAMPLSDHVARRLNRDDTPPARPLLEFGGNTDWDESWSERVVAHAPAITLVLLLIGALAALSFFYRVQVGQSLVRLGEKISGEPAQESAVSVASANASTLPVQPLAQPAAASPQSESPQQAIASANPATEQAVSSSNPPVTNADIPTNPPVDLPKNSEASLPVNSHHTASSLSEDRLDQPPAEKPAPPASADVEDGEADFRFADAFFREARTPEAKARAAELLWAAVSAGSSDAEIELADAYGRGDGVRKNCQQAGILLAAARNKDNPLAEKESAELRVYGCR